MLNKSLGKGSAKVIEQNIQNNFGSRRLLEDLFSSSFEYLQDPAMSSYLDSRGHVCVVQVERPNKTETLPQQVFPLVGTVA